MSIREVRHQFQRAADRNIIREDQVNKFTLMTVLEAGQQAFQEAYFGNVLETQLENVRGMDHDAKERALIRTEATIDDFARLRKVHREMHTTSDFPLAVALSRDYTRKPAYLPPDTTELFRYATRRVANDFKRLRVIRSQSFDQLFRRPEGTNVQYLTVDNTEEGYSIGSFAAAVQFTWEAWVNDDIGEFSTQLATLGLAARRTRGFVLIDAIRNGLDRVTLDGSAGGPTIGRIAAAEQYFAEMQFDGKAQPRSLSDIVYPPAWNLIAKEALNSPVLIVSGGANQKAISPVNVAYQAATPYRDLMLAERVPAGQHARDWLAVSSQQWLEFTTLRGYEGGPKTFTKLPDVVETIDEGSFENKSIAIKIEDYHGAVVTEKMNAIIVAGG